jgi:uncharacterized protein YqhQ
MAADVPRMRLGGMALANGLLVHGPGHWAAAVVDEHGRTIVRSGPRPRLSMGSLDKVPLARGLARMAEMLMVVPAARAGVPEARLAMEDGPIGPIMAASMAATAASRRLIRSAAGQEAVAAALALAPPLLALRASDAAAWHAVEHKSIAAYERAGEAGLADNARDPKEHDRCGSNLVLPMVVASAVGNLLARRLPSRRARMLGRITTTALAVGASVEAFAFAERHPRHPVSRAVHGAGHAIQAGFVTREPDERQLAVGRAAMQEILRVEQAAAVHA